MKELAPGGQRLRIARLLWGAKLYSVAFALDQAVEIVELVGLDLRFYRYLASQPALHVDDLVLQDTDHPCLKLRARLEAAGLLQRRDRGFRDHVFGPHLVAQPHPCEFHKHGTHLPKRHVRRRQCFHGVLDTPMRGRFRTRNTVRHKEVRPPC